MSSNVLMGSWKEDICPEFDVKVSAESFEELLESINFSEKNNNEKQLIKQWCEDYCCELEVLGKEIILEEVNLFLLKKLDVENATLA